VTVDMSVNAIQPFEELTDQDGKSLWKWDAWRPSVSSWVLDRGLGKPTYPTRKHGLIINIALDPRHQMFDVFRRGHLRGSLEVLRVLP